MSGRNAQVSRIYAILNLLDGNRIGLSALEIFEKINKQGYEASKRTVYRDLEALQQAGFPLTNTDDGNENTDGALWILDRNARINDYLALNFRELASLYMARASLSPLRDTPLFQDLETAFNKIEAKLGPRAQEFLLELAGDFHFAAGPKWGLGLDADTLETVRASTAEKQILKCTYKSVNTQSTKERRLGPHYLYFSKGSIYLVAEDFSDRIVKVFSLARMSSCEMLDEEYKGEISNPENYFKDSFGIFANSKSEHVVLEFSKSVGPFIKERKWHSSQRVTSKQDGQIECHLEVAISPELIQWVLGFGAEVKVLEPVSLQNEIRSKASKILEMYARKAA